MVMGISSVVSGSDARGLNGRSACSVRMLCFGGGTGLLAAGSYFRDVWDVHNRHLWNRVGGAVKAPVVSARSNSQRMQVSLLGNSCVRCRAEPGGVQIVNSSPSPFQTFAGRADCEIVPFWVDRSIRFGVE